MCPSSDPVGLGFVASLRRPGGNLTGINLQYEETTGKRLQLLREMLPRIARAAFIWNAQGGRPQMEVAEKAALTLGLKLQSIEVAAPDALPGAFAAAVKGRAEALMLVSTSFMFGLRSQITALALTNRLPSIYPLAANADAGGLMSYGPNDSAFDVMQREHVQALIVRSSPFMGEKRALIAELAAKTRLRAMSE